MKTNLSVVIKIQMVPALVHVRVCVCVFLTCFRVDGEEILRVASCDAITQTAGYGGEVRVLGLDTDDGHVLWRVLHDDRMVDGI